MHNQKYKLTEDVIELELMLMSDLPRKGNLPLWHVYFERIGTNKESVLGYIMRTVGDAIVHDQLLVHVEVNRNEELSTVHLLRNRERILKEMERIGHIVRVHRIEAIRHFGNPEKENFVPPGAKGGYVQRLTNLSHDGDCWVDDDAIVCGDATVCDDAIVCGSALIAGGSVYEKAHIGANAKMYDGAVCGRARIAGSTVVTVGDRLCGDTIYDGLLTPPPTIIYKTSKAEKDAAAKASSFCQFPFNNGRPRLPRRTPGGSIGYDLELD